MRPIKFRLWNEYTRSMENPGDRPFAISPWGVPLYDGFQMENRVVMQYTGLRDRNGIEIYEGDLVIVTNDADERPIVGIVEWLHDFWNISVVENSLWALTRNGYVEVIGNIYKNNELLDLRGGDINA